jgi:enediyne polyketide synthase
MKGNKRKSGRIAVVGMSCWYPGSRSLSEFWENILARRQQFRRMPDERLPLDQYHNNDRNAEDKTYGTEAAVIDGFQFDWQQKRIPRRAYDATDIVHWLALDVAQKALADTGIALAKLQQVQTGVVLGNTLTGEWTRTNAMRMRWPFVEKTIRANGEQHGLSGEALESFVRSVGISYKSVFPEVTEDTLAGGLSNTIAGRICNVFDLHGGGYTVDGACSSSLLAIINAARSLVQGDLDVAFAGGIDISLDTFELIGFAKTGALTTDEMRVYDKRANGFIPGEGCGFVVLKRLADAERDGDKIYAVINGWGLSSDGKGGLTAPSVDGQARAITKAYDMAGYPLADVSFVEGHGTGTTLGDKVEISALVQVLGDQIPAERVGLTSLKSIVGHTKAAAGIGGLIKAAIAVNQRIAPPMAGVEDPNVLFTDSARHFEPLMLGRRYDPKAIIRAGVSAMGFGGINTHVTLESYGPVQDNLRPSADEDLLLVTYDTCELLIFSAHSQTELKQTLTAAAGHIAGLSRAELGDYARYLSGLARHGNPVRCAVVARRPSQAHAAVLHAVQLLAQPLGVDEQRSSEHGGATVWLGSGAKTPKIAMLFPGQGAQKPQMAEKLIRRYEWAQEKARIADSIFSTDGRTSLSGIISSRDQEAQERLNQTEITQPAITLANALWFELLSRCGIRADVTAGHSLGELSALYAAGAFDFTTLITLATERGRLMAGQADQPGAMAWVGCNGQRTQELVSAVNGYVAIANLNSPEQTVVGGEAAAVEAVVALAQDQGVRAGLLKVSNAFHTRFMDNAAKKFAVIAARKCPGTVPAGFIGAAQNTDAGGMKVSEYLGRQLRESVDFRSLAAEVAKQADLVLEVGPGHILSGLMRQNHAAVMLAVESRPYADQDFKQVIAAAYAAGVRIRWDEVYRNRFFNSYVSTAEKTFLDNPVERPMTVPAVTAAVNGMPVMVRETVIATTEPVIAGSSVAAAVVVPAPVTVAAREEQGPEAVIMQIVADLTGFEAGSLQPDLRLLDDLNLDSIKVTELIYRLTAHYQISEQLETSAYTNASIAEVAAAVRPLIPAVTDQPRVAVPPVAAVMSAAPAVSPASPSATAPVGGASVSGSLVRNFTETFVEEPIADIAAWKDKRVTIISAADDRSFSTDIADRLRDAGADVLVVSRAEELRHADLTTRQVTVMFVPAAVRADDQEDLVNLLAGTARTRYGKGHALVFAQFDDGRFGESIVSDRLFGAKSFATSVGMERPDMKVRALSFHNSLKAPTDIARLIGAEIGQSEAHYAAVYDENGVRLRLTLTVDRPGTYSERGITFTSDDVLVVTGGAKGITRACAEAFVAAHGCRVAVIGSSPWTDEQQSDASHLITVAMTSYRALAPKAAYYACDLADSVQVATVMEKIKSDLGAPTVIIHGAGLNTPKPTAAIEAHEALREMAPKVNGMRSLLAGCDATALKFIGALTSIIGVTGMPGNAWYAFANEALDLQLRRFSSGTGVPVCSFAYSVWSEIGMGARMGSDKHLAQRGIGAVSPEEGVSRFMQLVTHAAADQQTVIAGRLGALFAGKAAPEQVYTTSFAQHLQSLQPGVEAVARVRLNHAEHPYLLDHNYKGSYLFPTVFGLEAMAQVAQRAVDISSAREIILEEIKLTRPIVVGDNGLEIEIHAEVEEQTTADTQVRIRCGIRTAMTGFKVDHFSAVIAVSAADIAPVLTLPAGDDLGIVPRTDLYGSVLFQGERFQRLEKILHLESDNETEGRTLFTSRLDQDCGQGYLLGDPYFRDSLLQSAQIIIPQNQCLPIEIERIRTAPAQRRTMTRVCFSDVYKSGDKTYLATIEVRAGDGTVIERLENYQLRFLEKKSELPKAMDLIPTQNLAAAGVSEVPAVPSNPLLTPYHPVADLLRIDAEPNGPQDQAVFVHRFIPDFKSFSNLSRSIHFTHIFNWMGWAREMSSIPVLDRIRSLTETGKYGLVTNWASIEVLGECRNKHRIVEARMWCGKMTGQKNSSAVLTFDWVSRGEDGIEERIAVGRMGFTWVEIIGHGLVQPAEFPPYYQDFIASMVAKNDNPDEFVATAEPYRNLTAGEEIWRAASGPGTSINLCSKFFETSLYDANLVGNLYFGNYSIWMGKLRDEYFHSLAPGLFRGIGELGEMTCVNARIQHLREAMPFDDIYVTMGMRKLATCGAELHFEFFKVDANGHREKLAVASHEFIWTVAAAGGERVPAPIPSPIWHKLAAKLDNTISIAAAS